MVTSQASSGAPFAVEEEAALPTSSSFAAGAAEEDRESRDGSESEYDSEEDELDRLAEDEADQRAFAQRFAGDSSKFVLHLAEQDREAHDRGARVLKIESIHGITHYLVI